MKHVVSMILFFYSIMTVAAVHLNVDATSVTLGQQFTINLSLSGQASEEPELDPLEKDFNIIGIQRSSSYQIIQNQVDRAVQWRILITPKRVGKLIIPAIKIGQEKTPEQIIEVKDTGQDTNSIPTGKVVMLTSKAEKTDIFINEEVIYTVKLYSSESLANVEYQGPQFADGLIISLGSGRSYQTVKEGKIYTVEEQRYAIFPQKSGTLTIKPPTLKGLLYQINSQNISVKANPVTLHVKSAPPAFNNKAWIPASNVTLQQEYDKSLSHLKVGDTLTRTVRIQAEGFPGQLLPKIVVNNEKTFRVYLEALTPKNNLVNNNLVGEVTLKLTYLFDKPGDATIPALDITWFDVDKQQKMQAVLPPMSLSIIQNTSEVIKSPVKKISPIIVTQTSRAGWTVAGIMTALWILTLLGWWFTLRNKKSNPLNDLKSACGANNPQKAQEALLAWGRTYWPHESILDLNNLKDLVEEPGFKDAILELSNVLYQPKSMPWQGNTLWQYIVTYTSRRPNKKVKKERLPPLF